MWVIFDHLRPSGHIMPDHVGDRGAVRRILKPYDHLRINHVRSTPRCSREDRDAPDRPDLRSSDDQYRGPASRAEADIACSATVVMSWFVTNGRLTSGDRRRESWTGSPRVPSARARQWLSGRAGHFVSLRRDRQYICGPDSPALGRERRPLPARAVPAQVQFAVPLHAVGGADRRSASITRLAHVRLSFLAESRWSRRYASSVAIDNRDLVPPRQRDRGVEPGGIAAGNAGKTPRAAGHPLRLPIRRRQLAA